MRTGTTEHDTLQSFGNLRRCRIMAANGEVGGVRDIYFDDEQWVVRYLVVDTGGWLSGRSVLISPYAVRFINWDRHTIVISLSRDQVKHSPGIDTDKPVSRQQEAEYHRYYGYPPYWPCASYWALGRDAAGRAARSADSRRGRSGEARRRRPRRCGCASAQQ
ncbi:MAG: PRC-barrel domain-containing protein [Gammaproteobacteria bacterium]